MTDMLTIARDLLARGFSVIPLDHPDETTQTDPAGVGKVPVVPLENRLDEWRRLLRGSTTQGRTVLQRILRGRLTFTPRKDPFSGEVDGYDFRGPTRFDRLFTGVAVEPKAWMKDYSSRRGFEDTTPEDTFDGDYGRLLDAAYKSSVEVLASLAPTSWNPIAHWLNRIDDLRQEP